MYKLVLALLLVLLVPSPVSADSGVAVTLTTTVTENNDWPFDPGDGAQPYTPPNWAKVFPSMNQPSNTQSSPPYVNPQQPIPLPPPVVNPTPKPQPPPLPVGETPENKDMWVYLLILLGAILIGLILYLIIPQERSKNGR